jgi:DNA-binding CsgD family transcriptional regulator
VVARLFSADDVSYLLDLAETQRSCDKSCSNVGRFLRSCHRLMPFDWALVWLGRPHQSRMKPPKGSSLENAVAGDACAESLDDIICDPASKILTEPILSHPTSQSDLGRQGNVEGWSADRPTTVNGWKKQDVRLLTFLRSHLQPDFTARDRATMKLISPMLTSEEPRSLSPRLQQVLDDLLRGLSEKECARHLNLSCHTVHDYVKAIYKHFKVGSRGQLLATFLRKDAAANSVQMTPRPLTADHSISYDVTDIIQVPLQLTATSQAVVSYAF